LNVMIIALIGIFLGVFVRTVSPALRKIKEAAEKQEEFKWNHKYTVTAVASFLSAFTVTLLAYPTFQIPTGNLYLVFSSAFIFGSGLNSLINEVQAWF